MSLAAAAPRRLDRVVVNRASPPSRSRRSLLGEPADKTCFVNFTSCHCLSYVKNRSARSNTDLHFDPPIRWIILWRGQAAQPEKSGSTWYLPDCLKIRQNGKVLESLLFVRGLCGGSCLPQPLPPLRVFFQRRSVGSVNRALRWHEAGRRAASDASRPDEFGNRLPSVVPGDRLAGADRRGLDRAAGNRLPPGHPSKVVSQIGFHGDGSIDPSRTPHP
jgi:hypothetical protein